MPPPSTPCSLAWRGITYQVGAVVTLTGATGIARPGMLVGVVCGDAAGRALLCVLAGRPTRSPPGGQVLLSPIPQSELRHAASAPAVSLRTAAAPVYDESGRSPEPSMTATAAVALAAADAAAGATATAPAASPRKPLHARAVALSLRDDVHAPYETVRESLWMSAQLRTDSSARKSRGELDSFVSSILSTCELEAEADQTLDALQAHSKGNISLGTRIRIAIELAVDPAVLLVEGPAATTDVIHTRSIMRILRRIAASGRAVIVTLHSAGAEAPLECSHLALLHEGVQAWWGPTGGRSGIALSRAARLQTHATASTLEYDASYRASTKSIQIGAEPPQPSPSVSVAPIATTASTPSLTARALTAASPSGRFVVVTPSTVDSSSDLVQRALRVFVEHEQQREQKEEGAGHAASSPSVDAAGTFADGTVPAVAAAFTSASFDAVAVQADVARTPAALPLLLQFAFMQFRLVREETRNIPLNLSRNVQFVGLSLFLGLLFLNIGSNPNDIKAANAEAALIFFLCSVAAGTCCSSILAHYFARTRPWVYRERAVHSYVPEAFSFAILFADLTWLAISSIVVNAICYFMADLDPSRFAFHLLGHVLLCWAYGSFGTFVAGVAPSAAIGSALVAVFSLFNVILAGSFLSVALIPTYWKWCHESVPIAWAVKALLLNQFYCDDSVNMCPAFVGSPLPGVPTGPITRYGYFSTKFVWTYEQRWEALGNLGYCILAYKIATVLVWRLHYGAAKV